jgi:hypothetical protein
VGDRVEGKKGTCNAAAACTCADKKVSKTHIVYGFRLKSLQDGIITIILLLQNNYNCNHWKGLGYCATTSKYSFFMKENCITTCGNCPNRAGGWSNGNSCVNGLRKLVCSNPSPLGTGVYCSGSNTESC